MQLIIWLEIAMIVALALSLVLLFRNFSRVERAIENTQIVFGEIESDIKELNRMHLMLEQKVSRLSQCENCTPKKRMEKRKDSPIAHP